MKSKWNKTIVVALLVVLVMAIGAVSVFAQAGTETPVVPQDGTTAVPGTQGFRGRGGFDFHGDRANNQSELADALGISVAELQAAQAKAQAARLAAAVAAGTLTQDQANLMLAQQALRGVIDREAIMAEALGLSVEELQAAVSDGTLRDLIANITPADLQARMQAAYTTAVQQAVTDNVITQAQADLVLAQAADGMGFGFGGMRGGHGRGGHGPGGGMRGFGAPLTGDADVLPGALSSAGA
jgi:hypothetical protein